MAEIDWKEQARRLVEQWREQQPDNAYISDVGCEELERIVAEKLKSTYDAAATMYTAYGQRG